MTDFDILTTGDLDLVNGDIRLIQGLDQVRQRIEVRLQTQRGEWDFDSLLGLDYLGEILIMNPDLGLVRSRVLELVASTPGVLQVSNIETTLEDRVLTIRFVFLVDPDFLTDDERADLGLEENQAAVVDDSAALDLDSGELNFFLTPVGPF